MSDARVAPRKGLCDKETMQARLKKMRDRGRHLCGRGEKRGSSPLTRAQSRPWATPLEFKPGSVQMYDEMYGLLIPLAMDS